MPKFTKIGLQVSGVMGLYNTPTWPTMVSTMVMRFFNAFLRFLKFSELCTLKHCNQTWLILWAIFVENAAKIENSQHFWKFPKNKKIKLQVSSCMSLWCARAWLTMISRLVLRCKNTCLPLLENFEDRTPVYCRENSVILQRIFARNPSKFENSQFLWKSTEIVKYCFSSLTSCCLLVPYYRIYDCFCCIFTVFTRLKKHSLPYQLRYDQI